MNVEKVCWPPGPDFDMCFSELLVQMLSACGTWNCCKAHATRQTPSIACMACSTTLSQTLAVNCYC